MPQVVLQQQLGSGLDAKHGLPRRPTAVMIRKRFLRRVQVGPVLVAHTIEVTNATQPTWRYVATVGVEGVCTGDGVIWMQVLVGTLGRVSQSKSVSVGNFLKHLM